MNIKKMFDTLRKTTPRWAWFNIKYYSRRILHPVKYLKNQGKSEMLNMMLKNIIKNTGTPIEWNRTYGGLNPKLPEENQWVILYFGHTGFDICQFNVIQEGDYKTDSFSGYMGFLGDEDLLWIPLPVLSPIPVEYKKKYGR